MHQVVVRKKAILRAQDAYDWYKGQSVSAANGFITALEECYSRLSANPLAYTFLNHRLRRIRLQGYPYLLIFEVKGNKVVVFTLVHTKRNTYLA